MFGVNVSQSGTTAANPIFGGLFDSPVVRMAVIVMLVGIVIALIAMHLVASEHRRERMEHAELERQEAQRKAELERQEIERRLQPVCTK